MATSRFKKGRQDKLIKTCAVSAVAFAIGWYMLFVISTSFKPPGGNTLYILAGCVFIAVSSLVLFVTLKNYFFPKRKRKRSNVVFLEDELKKASQKKESTQ